MLREPARPAAGAVRRGLSVSDPSYDDLLVLARDTATATAELIRSFRAAGVEVADTKSSDVDIVTEADRAAERLIHERLMSARPGDGFFGEEGGRTASTSGVTWVVDPIDGTVNFLYDIPHYAVSIAARVDDTVVAGVVLNVSSGECFSATLGGGATCDGRTVTVRQPVPLRERLVATGFNYVPEVRVVQAAAVAELLAQVRDVRRLGSAALDLCSVAAGRVDGYVEEGLNPWDMAAGALVATEAGARVETGTGRGGTTLVTCAPTDWFAEFASLVEACGFAAGTAGNT